MILRPTTMNSEPHLPADWRPRGTVAGTRACHDTCSGYHVNLIGARAKTGKLEHDGEPVEERVGQLQMSRCRTRLDSDVGGPFAFSLVRKYGDNHQHISTDLDLSFGGVARTVRNEDAGTHSDTIVVVRFLDTFKTAADKGGRRADAQSDTDSLPRQA